MFCAGLSPHCYEAEAKRLTERQLRKSLCEARRMLSHHGRRSFMGRESQKEIDAILREMISREINEEPVI